MPAILQVQPLVISRSVAAISSQGQNGTRVQTFQSKVSTWMPAAEFQKSTMSLSLVVEPILIKRQVPSLQPVTVRQTTINSRERSAAMRPVKTTDSSFMQLMPLAIDLMILKRQSGWMRKALNSVRNLFPLMQARQLLLQAELLLSTEDRTLSSTERSGIFRAESVKSLQTRFLMLRLGKPPVAKAALPTNFCSGRTRQVWTLLTGQMFLEPVKHTRHTVTLRTRQRSADGRFPLPQLT